MVGAVLLIVINHLVRFMIEEKKGTGVTIKNSFLKGMIALGVFFAISATFIVIGAILMSKGEFSQFLGFNDFNNGLILLVIGVSFALMMCLTCPYIYRGFVANYKKRTANE